MTTIRVPFSDLSDDALEHREALYVQLILSQRPESIIAQALHAKLCEVRLAMFQR